MMSSVRCFTCGKVLKFEKFDKFVTERKNEYKDKILNNLKGDITESKLAAIEYKVNEKECVLQHEVLDSMKIRRSCCRIRYITRPVEYEEILDMYSGNEIPL